MSGHAPFFFFFNDTATTEIYTLSLHDALPISLDDVLASLVEIGYTRTDLVERRGEMAVRGGIVDVFPPTEEHPLRSEEHTSELQSPCNLVCRLLLEKKKNTQDIPSPYSHWHTL